MDEINVDIVANDVNIVARVRDEATDKNREVAESDGEWVLEKD